MTSEATPDPPGGIDLGLTHIALTVADIDRSVAFYETYASMRVVHDRSDPDHGTRVAWLSDLTRPFVVVLLAVGAPSHPLGGSGHLGVAVADRAAVDDLVARARDERRRVLGPYDDGPPVGYWCIIEDPDGHNLELSHGQEVGFTVTGFERPSDTA